MSSSSGNSPVASFEWMSVPAAVTSKAPPCASISSARMPSASSSRACSLLASGR
jgi:hypothetical protein